MVAHVYNPRYKGGGDGRITVQGQPLKKKVSETPTSIQLDVVSHICNLSYSGDRGMRIRI
jgi:hypothetical protein